MPDTSRLLSLSMSAGVDSLCIGQGLWQACDRSGLEVPLSIPTRRRRNFVRPTVSLTFTYQSLPRPAVRPEPIRVERYHTETSDLPQLCMTGLVTSRHDITKSGNFFLTSAVRCDRNSAQHWEPRGDLANLAEHTTTRCVNRREHSPLSPQSPRRCICRLHCRGDTATMWQAKDNAQNCHAQHDGSCFACPSGARGLCRGRSAACALSRGMANPKRREGMVLWQSAVDRWQRGSRSRGPAKVERRSFSIRISTLSFGLVWLIGQWLGWRSPHSVDYPYAVSLVALAYAVAGAVTALRQSTGSSTRFPRTYEVDYLRSACWDRDQA